MLEITSKRVWFWEGDLFMELDPCLYIGDPRPIMALRTPIYRHGSSSMNRSPSQNQKRFDVISNISKAQVLTPITHGEQAARVSAVSIYTALCGAGGGRGHPAWWWKLRLDGGS
jgi:hypothetical protein